MTITQDLQSLILPIAGRIIGIIAVLLIGRWLARKSQGWLHKALTPTGMTESLIHLFARLIYFGIWFVTVLIVLSLIGVPTAVLVSSAGIVFILLGIALRESLADLAATVIFLIFQPFKVGDLIESGGTVGSVREIQMFHTVVVTGDNKVVAMPNGKIQDSNIVNYSRLGILRADLNVTISYTDDLAKAKRILEEIMTADERVLRDPPPQVIVLGLGESGVSLGVRPFAKLVDYWNLGPDLRERIKLRFDEEGITIPFPQQDVHLFQPARGDRLPVETGAANLTNPSF